MAGPVRLVIRRAAAAGPMSSAVDRIAPMVMADSDTAMARAARKAIPTRRVATPWARASSSLTELSSSGR